NDPRDDLHHCGWRADAAQTLPRRFSGPGKKVAALLAGGAEEIAQRIVPFAGLPHDEATQRVEVDDRAGTAANVPGVGGDRVLNQLDQPLPVGRRLLIERTAGAGSAG